MINKIILSDKFTIYRGKDEIFDRYKEECLRIVELNKLTATHFSNNSLCMETNSYCFRRVNDNIKTYIENFTERKFINYAEHYWVYTQTKGFDMEWMHQHLLVHPQGRSKILTDFTFTYYLQVPSDVSGDEGRIVFQTEDGTKHKFFPEEGDFFIFPAEIRHTAIPTPNSNTDRIVYAGSLCIDVYNQRIDSKNII